MVVLQVKAIKPQKMKLKEVRLEMLNALRKEGTQTEKLLDQTWATWKGDKPKSESLIGLTGKDATLLTGPVGSDLAVNKWVWLNEGTRIRWALMSSDWKSKTRPGKLKSGGGRGRVVVAGKRAMKRPRPGIQARGWTEIIAKRRRRPFTRAMIQAKNRGVAKIYD